METHEPPWEDTGPRDEWTDEDWERFGKAAEESLIDTLRFGGEDRIAELIKRSSRFND